MATARSALGVLLRWHPLGLAACGAPAEPCACADGHGVILCDGGRCTPCQCLRLAPVRADPAPAQVRFVDADAAGGDGSEAAPWSTPDWAALDRDLARGDVLVLFDAGDTWGEPLAIRRTDGGPARLVLDGHARRRTAAGWEAAGAARAAVPGVHTGYEDTPRSRVTVRGFDVTGSKDKGIYWRAGDEVILEDNLVHGNRGTPAISLDYTSRSGHRSTSFIVRNNHVWDQVGECIYIGGAEGQDLDAHLSVRVENNLVHDCTHPTSSQHDGINIKDRIGGVSVVNNVIFSAHWGIEIASPGVVRGNLIVATRSDGLHVTDAWGMGLSGLLLEDNAILEAGEAGIYLNATNHAWSEVTLSRITVSGARGAAIEAGGAAGIDGRIDDVVLTDSAVGLDAWSPMGFTLGLCTVHGNGLAGDRDFAALAGGCAEADPGFGDLATPAGPDGVFFTGDEPWISAAGGAGP